MNFSKKSRLCNGANGSCCPDLRGSSNAETETNDPNSDEDVEIARECGAGLDDVVGAMESNIGPGFGDAGGVGGEKSVANRSSVSSPLLGDPLGSGIRGGILLFNDEDISRLCSRFRSITSAARFLTSEYIHQNIFLICLSHSRYKIRVESVWTKNMAIFLKHFVR